MVYSRYIYTIPMILWFIIIFPLKYHNLWVIWCFSTKKSTTGRPDALYVSKRFGGIDHFDPALLRHKLAAIRLRGRSFVAAAWPSLHWTVLVWWKCSKCRSFTNSEATSKKWPLFTKNDLISMGGMGFLRFRWNTKNDMISSALWYFTSKHPHLSTSSNRNIYGENHPLS